MYSAFTHSCHSALPASVLDEEEDDDEEEIVGESRDDERSGTRYNVCGRLMSFCDFIADIQKVLLVPHYLRPRRDVCCDVVNRLVGISAASNTSLLTFVVQERGQGGRWQSRRRRVYRKVRGCYVDARRV